MGIIAISCYYHDSAAALINDEGKIIAAVQEERLSRIKHESNFPFSSVCYCVEEAKKNSINIDKIVYYEKPIIVFGRLLETYFETAPRGLSSFIPAMKTWISEKLFIKQNILNELGYIITDFNEEKLAFSEHHLSHASSAFYPSPFKKSAILCMDAVGEWATTSAWIGEGNNIQKLWQTDFPHSLGLLYSSFTYYCGFKVNSGEYKLMGLAPFGTPKYEALIMNNLINTNEDGSFELNMKYFKYHRGLRMISSKFINLFKKPPRNPEGEITQFYMDVASSIQKVVGDIIVKIANNLHKESGLENLCMSGGVALNCAINGRLKLETGFKKIWVQPASGDAGSSIGAALAFHHLEQNKPRKIYENDAMQSGYLGPKFTDTSIEKYLIDKNLEFKKYNFDDLFPYIASELSKGKIIGWFQGQMEFGPRSLGNRSILGDPRDPNMQERMNISIKFRESFRPFAPAILDKNKKEYFGLDEESPYMLFTYKINELYRSKNSKAKSNAFKSANERVKELRSTVPAITHLDFSCRVQTVSKERNERFYNLIEQFNEITGCPILINTSFNIRGEPIVCSPQDALRCFANTNIDILVLEKFIISRSDQKDNWTKKFPKILTIKD